MNTDQYLDKQLENEMDCEVLPSDYQEWLDSLEVKKPEPSDFSENEMFNSVDFNAIPF